MKSKIAALLFPPKCVFCGTILHNPQVEICEKCMESKDIIKILPKMPHTMFVDERVFTAWYRGAVRSSLHSFKFKHKPGYARAYAYLLYRHYLLSSCTYDYITWVPSNPWTVFKRGYNQAHVLAKEFAKFCKKPCIRMLRKNRKTKAMFTLSPSQRRANVMGAYTFCGPDVTDRKILLIDDIFTTGSTVAECAKVLKFAQCQTVGVYTFAGKKSG